MYFLPGDSPQPRFYFEKMRTYESRVALAWREHGQWKELSYASLLKQTEQLASQLIAQGMKAGDRIALIGESHPHYVVALLAVLRFGGVVVPLDARLTADERERIIRHSEARLTLDQGPIAELLSLPSLPALSESAGDAASDQARFILYTSGTTGSPKGVMLSWGAIWHEVNTLKAIYDPYPDRFLSLLPPNHLFELTGGLLYALFSGAQVNFANTLLATEITQCFVERKITRMLCVPLVLEMFKNGIEREVRKMPRWRQRVFALLHRLAPLFPAFLRRGLLFSQVHRKFGGHLRVFICGGAPLKPETTLFFNRMGFEVYQGYGLTETAPVLAVESPGASRLGSVGRPIQGVEIQITENGMLRVKGPNVMLGYYKEPDLTLQVLDAEGWFETGDLARLDQDGFLYILGRAKNLIVLPSGKKVHPEEVEDILSPHPHVEEICILAVKLAGAYGMGEGVGAVLVPREEAMKLSDEEIIASLQEFRARLADYKWPQVIRVARRPLPKTTTKKIIRHEVTRLYT